jgi:hypothetical protein
VAQGQTVSIAAPEGTPPGAYEIALVVYDAATGIPLPVTSRNGAQPREPGLLLGTLTVAPPAP